MSQPNKKRRPASPAPGYRIDRDGKQVPETRGRKSSPTARRLGVATSISSLELEEAERIAEELGVERSVLMYSFFRDGLDRAREGRAQALASAVGAPNRPLVYLAPAIPPDADPWTLDAAIVSAGQQAMELWKLGCVVVSPDMMTSRYAGAIPVATIEDGRRALLKRCDCILMAPGWQHSEYSAQTRAAAEMAGIAVFGTIARLAAWMEGGRQANKRTRRPTAAPVAS